MKKSPQNSIYCRASFAIVVVVALGAFALPTTAAPWRLSQSTEQPTTQPPADTVTGTSDKDETPAAVVDDRDAEGILGKKVRSSAGEDMGQVVDVIVKRDGQVRGAVIDFGGFLGVGSRKIAVDWSSLSFPSTGAFDHVVLNLTRDQVRLAPEYRPGEPVVVLGAASPSAASPGQTSQENPEQPEPPTPEK
jgi:hypothetical protein